MDYKWASGIRLTLGTSTKNDALAFCNTQGFIILGQKQASLSKFNHALLINGSSYESFNSFLDKMVFRIQTTDSRGVPYHQRLLGVCRQTIEVIHAAIW